MVVENKCNLIASDIADRQAGPLLKQLSFKCTFYLHSIFPFYSFYTQEVLALPMFCSYTSLLFLCISCFLLHVLICVTLLILSAKCSKCQLDLEDHLYLFIRSSALFLPNVHSKPHRQVTKAVASHSEATAFVTCLKYYKHQPYTHRWRIANHHTSSIRTQPKGPTSYSPKAQVK